MMQRFVVAWHSEWYAVEDFQLIFEMTDRKHIQ